MLSGCFLRKGAQEVNFRDLNLFKEKKKPVLFWLVVWLEISFHQHFEDISLVFEFSVWLLKSLMLLRFWFFVCLVFSLKAFIYLVAPGLGCGMQNPSSPLWHEQSLSWGAWNLQLQHVNSKLHHMGSSFLTRDGAWALCIRSAESKPLDHQRSLCSDSWSFFLLYVLFEFF